MVQQGALAPGADAGDFVELAGDQGLGAARPVRGDREAVGFIPEALEEIQHRVARRELEGFAAVHVKPFAAGITIRAFGDRDQLYVVHAEIRKYSARGRKLAAAAVDQHQIGPVGRC